MRLRFTIRDLLWFTAVTALAIALGFTWTDLRTSKKTIDIYVKAHAVEVDQFNQLYKSYQAIHDELKRIRAGN